MRKLRNEELNRLGIEEFRSAEKLPVVVVLDNVRSSNNIGSIFRTSDAFLVNKICLCGICSTPPDKEIHKTALGAEFSVDWEYFKTTQEAVLRLQKEGFNIVAVEQVEGSISLNNYLPQTYEKVALIFGIEIVEVKPGYAECAMTVTENHLNGIGILMGGALFTLADFTLALAANSHGTIAVTLNASISYLQKCSRGKVKAIATEVFRSEKTGLYHVNLKDEEGNLVAEVTGTCYFKKQSPRQTAV